MTFPLPGPADRPDPAPPERRRPGPPDDPTILGTGRARYSAWDGRQRLPDFDAAEILDQLSDDLMAEGDLSSALRRLLQRGVQGRRDEQQEGAAGLRELMQRLADRRRELLDRYQLGDVMADIRRELDEVVSTERHGIERRLAEASARPASSDGDAEPSGAEGARGADDSERAQSDAQPPTDAMRDLLGKMAARRQEALDALPADAGERIRALQDYDFLEPAARQRFEELLDRLRKQVLDTYFKGLSEQIKGVTPEDMAATREMVRDLDRLLQERLDGRDPDVSEFLARHGAAFPGARTLDDIIGQLADRMAAMQSLLASMTPAQRAELQSMMDSLLRDDRLRWDLAQLAATLDQLLPDGLGARQDFRGSEPLSLDGALEQMARLQSLERMGEQLGDADDPAALADVDPDEVRRLLGEESAQDLRALQDVARKLEEAGYAERRGDRLELTARGTRRVGQRVLDELFARLRRDAFGGHAIHRGGGGGERSDETIRYEFGRPFHLDLQRTLSNALVRTENALVERSSPGVSLSPADFEIFQTEEMTSASTVLLVDMSRSMLLRGCFLAAKKVAVALDTLIRTRFPRDELHVVGFAYYAREIRPGALAALSWHGYEYGTNLQHGLLLARRLLAKSKGGNREIVIITDGEPTAHFEGGHVEFSYPPTRRTVQETLKEVARCTREGITINTFMLERSRALAEFVERMTKLNRGRAFYATPERLGEYVLVDYVGKKTKRV